MAQPRSHPRRPDCSMCSRLPRCSCPSIAPRRSLDSLKHLMALPQSPSLSAAPHPPHCFLRARPIVGFLERFCLLPIPGFCISCSVCLQHYSSSFLPWHLRLVKSHSLRLSRDTPEKAFPCRPRPGPLLLALQALLLCGDSPGRALTVLRDLTCFPVRL